MQYQFEMTLEYPKVFEANRDMGGDDNDAARMAKSKDGLYIVNAYFNNQDDLDKLKADGVKEVVLGHPRFITGNAEMGIGTFMKLKRYHSDPKSFKDKKGKVVTLSSDGPPRVVNLTDGVENVTPWDFDTDGPLGNGTKAIVKFSTYKNGGGVRLDGIGVTEHVKWENNSSIDEDNWDV